MGSLNCVALEKKREHQNRGKKKKEGTAGISPEKKYPKKKQTTKTHHANKHFTKKKNFAKKNKKKEK